MYKAFCFVKGQAGSICKLEIDRRVARGSGSRGATAPTTQNYLKAHVFWSLSRNTAGRVGRGRKRTVPNQMAIRVTGTRSETIYWASC